MYTIEYTIAEAKELFDGFNARHEIDLVCDIANKNCYKASFLLWCRNQKFKLTDLDDIDKHFN